MLIFIPMEPTAFEQRQCHGMPLAVDEGSAGVHCVSILGAHGIEAHQFELIQLMFRNDRLVEGYVDGCFFDGEGVGLVSFHGFGFRWLEVNGPGGINQ